MTLRLLTMFALVLGLALEISSCGSSKSTAPYGGGGVAPTGPSFNMAFPQTGTSNSFSFPAAGTWDYHCTPHSGLGMIGSVTVVLGGADSALVAVGDAASSTHYVFVPSTVSIRPGGIVRWVNVSSMTMHTVTRP